MLLLLNRNFVRQIKNCLQENIIHYCNGLSFIFKLISNTEKHSVEYKNQRLIATPYYLFSANSNYRSCLWLNLISISIIKIIIRQFCKRFLLVSHENNFICLITFGSNFVLDSLKRRS